MNTAPPLRRTILLTLVLVALGAATAGLLLSRGDANRFRARMGGSTAALYAYTTPPPWPVGNILSVMPGSTWWWDRYLARFRKRSPMDMGWRVVNMHAENFHAACTNFGLKSVLVERLDDQLCLIVDPRIPRDWLLTTPSCDPLALRQRIRSERPERFREDPLHRLLIGRTWRLVNRQDDFGVLTRYLPGDRLQFGMQELKCLTAEGAILAQRAWELRDDFFATSLRVYELTPAGFNGIGLKVSPEGHTLTFTPQSILSSDGKSSTGESYSSYHERLRFEQADRERRPFNPEDHATHPPTQVTYRLEMPNSP